MIRRREFLAAVSAAAGAFAAPARPNLVFIYTDDQRQDILSFLKHPFVKTPNLDRLRREGVWFENAFVTTSLCSPSRAAFLTGTYNHTNGVFDNRGKEFDPERTPSYGQLLQKAGYETAYVGKWHQARRNDPRPGFDYWLSFTGQGVYNDPPLNENGREFTGKGYMTDILTDAAVKFLRRARSKPFCLTLGHKALHGPFTPAERHKDLHKGAVVPEPPNYKEDRASKPAWLGLKAEPKPWGHDDGYLDYYRALAAVDESVGKVYDALKETGQLDNTVFVFSSDNGYFKGEHSGRGDKRLFYEESIRIPFIVRYPKLAKANSTVKEMVLNIDLAPTFLELAGAPKHAGHQGMSWAPLLAGKKPAWRKSFLYEYWVDLNDIPRMIGVRAETSKLVRYPDIQDIPEMYDLRKDPHEKRNVAMDPAYAEERKRLEAELERLMQATGYKDRPPEPNAPAAKPAKAKRRKQG